MALPLILAPILAGAAGLIGSVVSANQARRQNQAQANAAERQRGLITEATDRMQNSAMSMEHYADRMSQANPYIKGAIGDVGRRADQMDDVYSYLQDAFGGVGRGMNMAERAGGGLDTLVGQINRHMNDIRNTDYSSAATDMISRQGNALNAARGISGSGVANANVAGALAQVNAQDAARRQGGITELLAQLGGVHGQRGALAQLIGGLGATQGQIAGTMGDVRSRQADMHGMQANLGSMLAQIAQNQAGIHGQVGQLQAQRGQLMGHEAFAQPDASAYSISPLEMIGIGLGGGLGGASQGLGAQISTPGGMEAFLQAFGMGGGGGNLSAGQQAFNAGYTPFLPDGGRSGNPLAGMGMFMNPGITANVNTGGGFTGGYQMQPYQPGGTPFGSQRLTY